MTNEREEREQERRDTEDFRDANQRDERELDPRDQNRDGEVTSLEDPNDFQIEWK